MAKKQLVLKRVKYPATVENMDSILDSMTLAGHYGAIAEEFQRLEPLAEKGKVHEARMKKAHDGATKIPKEQYEQVKRDFATFFAADTGRGAVGRAEKQTADKWGVEQRTINRIRCPHKK